MHNACGRAEQSRCKVRGLDVEVDVVFPEESGVRQVRDRSASDLMAIRMSSCSSRARCRGSWLNLERVAMPLFRLVEWSAGGCSRGMYCEQ